MSKLFTKSRFLQVMALSASAVLVSCASVPERPAALAQAQAEYSVAAHDPNVARHAPEELDKANKALRIAQQKFTDKEELTEVSHYAYLAKQHTEAAKQIAQAKIADQTIAKANEDRNSALLSAKAKEIQQAKEQSLTAEQRAQQAEAKSQSLEQQLSQLNAKRTNSGIVLTLSDVLFDVGRASLKPGAYRTIDQFANVMKQHSEINVRVEGFTDSTGSDDYNQQLSQDRASTVKTALIDRGIQSTRIDARGFGESTPVATNETAAGRQANRRVEIIVLPEANSEQATIEQPGTDQRAAPVQ